MVLNETIAAINVTNTTIGAVSGIDPNYLIISTILNAVSNMAILGLLLGMPYIAVYRTGSKLKNEVMAFARENAKPCIVLQHHDAGIFGQMILPSTSIKLAKALRRCGGKDVDLILHTCGGDLFSSLQIAKMIKDYPGDVNVIVPKFAMSGGTMISLACDSMQMARTASMGPVDPQIGGMFGSYSSKAWQRILKTKGRRADDKSIAMSLLAKQCDDMVKVEVEGITGRKDIDFLFGGDVVHSMQFGIDFMRKHGFEVGLLDDEKAERIIEVMDSKHEVMVCFPKKKGKGWKVEKC